MNNNKLKIILVSGLFLSFTLPASARGDWKLKENRNTLTVTGACSGHDMRVDLFEENNSKPVYTSGALCQNGEFSFSDDLLRWESLSDGEYSLVVNGDRQNTKNVTIERPAEGSTAVPAAETSANSTGAPSSGNGNTYTPETKFFSAFVSLQQSILDMRTWLSKTNYPTLAKESMGMALDGLDLAAGKFSDLVLDSESAAIENSVAENGPNLELSTDQPAPLPPGVPLPSDLP